MKSRILWFVAGTTAGVYGTFKARRAAYRLTPVGLADQIASWQVGARAFTEEMRTGMQQREAEIAERLGMPSHTARQAPAVDPTSRPSLPLTPYDE